MTMGRLAGLGNVPAALLVGATADEIGDRPQDVSPGDEVASHA
jgi:hypothetical protein